MSKRLDKLEDDAGNFRVSNFFNNCLPHLSSHCLPTRPPPPPPQSSTTPPHVLLLLLPGFPANSTCDVSVCPYSCAWCFGQKLNEAEEVEKRKMEAQVSCSFFFLSLYSVLPCCDAAMPAMLRCLRCCISAHPLAQPLPLPPS